MFVSERKRLQPYGPQESEQMFWPRPEVDQTRGFCDAENRLKELYIERWLSWLNGHPEKITLIQAILTLCQSQDSEATKSDRAYTFYNLAKHYPDTVPTACAIATMYR